MEVDEITKAIHECRAVAHDQLTAGFFEKARVRRQEGTPNPANPDEVWRVGPSGSGHYVKRDKIPTNEDYYNRSTPIKSLFQLKKGNKVFLKIGNAETGFTYYFAKVKSAAKDHRDDVTFVTPRGTEQYVKPGGEWRVRLFSNAKEGKIDPSEAGKVKAADGPEARVLDEE